jgi:hypothetical protein
MARKNQSLEIEDEYGQKFRISSVKDEYNEMKDREINASTSI